MYLKNKYLLRTCFQCCKKKTLEISLFCICVPKISMIWSTVSEIKSVTDNDQENKNFEKMKKNPWRYYHFTHDVWDMECHGQHFCHRTIFCLMTKKIKFWKNEKKKTFEDILHKCFKNHDMCLTVPEIQPVTDNFYF